jgi:hypothetical protein
MRQPLLSVNGEKNPFRKIFPPKKKGTRTTNLKNFASSLEIWWINVDRPVEPPGSSEGLIKDIGSVCTGQYDNSALSVEA